MSRFVRCAVAAALATIAFGAAAQQRAPAGNGGTPRAPTGIQVAPLDAGPFLYKTAEGQDIRVVVHTRGLVRPWSLVWLPSGEMLVTERGGALRIVRDGVLDPQPIAGVPEVRAQGLSGLFDVALHPQFATNRFVYLSYNKPIAERQNGLGVARGVLNGNALTDVRDIFVTTDSSSVSRLAFGRDGKLYVTTFGNAGDGANAQNPMSHAGKVLRLNDDGSVPGDNPFAGNPGYKPEIYTLGHRSTLALVVNPRHGRALGERERPERRRRDQHTEARRELRLAAREHGPLVPGTLAVERLLARRLRGPRRLLDAVDRRLGHGVLHRRASSRSGPATCSSAACAWARFRAPAICSAFSSTTTGRSCAARCCSSICGNASATCGRGPTSSFIS